MGVKGLWKILSDSGVPVSLESLEGKVLGVDVSIWFHQAMHGCKGIGGSSVSNSHLLVMFHRICKLLFYRIRPIFIFDGSVPYLKKQTISARRLRKEVALNKVRRTRERLLANLLKSQAVRKALGKKGPGPSLHHVPRQVKREKDLFELPPIDPNKDLIRQALVKDEYEDRRKHSNSSHCNLHSFNLESQDFKDLTLYAQHEVLFEMQDTRKENSWSTINQMPQEATDFSGFQMNRLLKRQRFQQTLDDVRVKIQKLHSAEMEARLLGELESYVSHSQRIISEDSAHVILSKKAQALESKEDKIESPSLPKEKSCKRDFLTELAKSGLIKEIKDSSLFIESDSESASEIEESDNEDSEIPPKRKRKLEEENFMKVMDYVLDDSELTQEEILAVIKQARDEAGESTSSHIPADKPSTSKDAYNSLNLKESQSLHSEPDGSNNAAMHTPDDHSATCSNANSNYSFNKDTEDANVKAILGAKTNSLYLKIVQHKLDEMVNFSDISDAPLDTRKLSKRETKVPNKMPHKETVSEAPEPDKDRKEITIAIDLNKPMNYMEDDIFNDIFPISSFKKENLSSLRNSNSKDSNYEQINSTKTKIKNGKLEAHNPKNKKCLKNINDHSGTKEAISLEKLALENLTDSNGEISEELKDQLNNLVKLEIEKILEADKKGTDNSQDGKSPPESIEKKPLNEGNPNSDLKESFEAKIHLNSTIDSDSSSNDSFIDVPEPTHIVNNGHNEDGIFKDVSSVHKSISNEGMSNSSDNSNTIIHDLKLPSDSIANKIDKSEKFSIKSSFLKNANEDSLFANQTVELCDSKSEDRPFTANEDNIASHHAKMTCTTESFEDSLSSEDSFIEEEPTDSTPTIEEVHQQNHKNENGSQLDQIPCSNEQLTKIEAELSSEQEQLCSSVNKMERLASSMNNQMYSDAQELLQLFGLPYLVAPAEAEAQCAFLESVELSQGTITDDSDIFLFGGKRVYKNFFTQAKHVEMFNDNNINHQLGLDQQKMIALALLTGSDYTMGIESIGSVLAMEILSEFPGIGIDNLHNLKKWWEAAQAKSEVASPSKLKQRLKSLYFPESFPSENIFKAYLAPEVDESTEKFSWAYPDADRLKVFAMQRFGWSFSKIEEILNPLFKKIGQNLSQRRLDSYFDVKLTKEHRHTSKRLKEAIAKVKGEVESGSPKRPITPKVTSRNQPNSRKKTKPVDPPLRHELKEASASHSTNPGPSTQETVPLSNEEVEAAPLISNMSRQQKRAKEFKKLFLRNNPENTQVQKDKQKMEIRKRLAAEILLRDQRKIKKTRQT